LAFAAAVGKALGGILADRIGLRRWSLGALAVAAPLLSVAGQRLVLLAAGLALLQSAMAPMLTLMAQTAPRFPATAAGLALGLGIGLGGLPFSASPRRIRVRQ
jgi:MFS transporter, FSR family, fosmidomycin resistance protein